MSTWPSIALARRHDAALRVPFGIDTPHGAVHVGSVARAHLQALARWQPWLQAQPQALHLACPAHERSARLAEVNAALREARLIHGWRDETYAVVTAPGAEPLALVERAASRFWGTLTFGAHCNAYVADPRGRPTHLWIARRSFTKPTDPGLLDNLIGGGVPHGQTPFEALVREGWEEAGLAPHVVAAAVPGRVVHLYRDIPEGLQHEHLHVFDLPLPAGTVPRNQDGEVAELWLASIDEALALAGGSEMTVDASLATLDFALRHGLLGEAALAQRAAALWTAAPSAPGPAGR
jgi:8-oxo-dGTP pyrophosphatase MutT (NUDIX family)